MKKSLLIVGAHSAIGQALTRLAQAEFTVHALSRTPIGEDAAVIAHLGSAVTDPLPDLSEPLTGLVYCPGTIRLKPFNSLGAEEFLQDLQINVLGAIRCLQRYGKNLQASGEGAVVLISSVAVQTGFPFHTSVATAKGAVEGLTRALAAEWAPKVRVNAVAPSLTETPLAARLLSDSNRKQQADQRHPLGRIGQAQDIAEAALFLLSPRSAWMTGQIMKVDGGISALRL